MEPSAGVDNPHEEDDMKYLMMVCVEHPDPVAADLDEAIELASKHPVAKYGALELRPFWPMNGSAQ